jgi:glutamate-ammonia-ligase adenylyltransferase
MTDPSSGGRPAWRLTRLSFAHGAAAAELLSGDPLRWWDPATNAPPDDHAAAVVAAMGRTADPDAVLAALAEMIAGSGGAELRTALEHSQQLRARLLNLLGVSSELAAHLVTRPGDWRALVGQYDADGVAGRLAASVRADAVRPVSGTAGVRAGRTGDEAITALRNAYRRELVAIAGRDLAGDLELGEVTAALADLAGHTLQAALAVAAAGLPDTAEPFRLAIIAMGKAGGHELNYVSDVDVVFVAEPGESDEAGTSDRAPVDHDRALAAAARLAAGTMRICRAVAWEVDAALRPEGKDGPLVRTLASHEAYYQRWASTWEFQALLKARPVAGDAELGERYRAAITPLVWTAAERPDFVADVQAMRRRVIANLPTALAEREIKLGRGGLRDVEFAVQLLQLVHGRGDEALRVGATLPALDALRDGGYVGVDDAVSLIDAYRFLRETEHRLQLRRLRRTHVVPDDPAALLWLGRAMGYRPDARGDARAVWKAEWALHAREVRRLHEKLFYRPLLAAVARVPSEGLRLTPSEAGRRLAALGFADPAAALRHIEALTTGLSRRAALQRALLPVLLSEFADAPDPDGGLLAYRQVSDQLGSTPWYLRLLRDEGAVASRLAHLLGTSRYVARMLGRAPEALQMLADDDELAPRDPAETLAAMIESAARQDGPDAGVAVVRGLRRQELLRTAFADLLGRLDVAEVCQAISATTEATLDVTLRIAARAVAAELGVDELPIRFAIIAMGRLGGAETGYGSDADVMFVHERRGAATTDEKAARVAQDVAGRLRALLASPSSNDPPLEVDANLRPEGRDGPLVRSLASYASYYARWSSPWEAQALLRARFAAGDDDLGRRFIAMIDPVRYPVGGVAPGDLFEIRRLKGRVDSERLPPGADPATHTKLGRGGLTDIEWTVQLLQLSHGHEVAGLRTTRTLDALRAAAAAELLSAEQARLLTAAWQLATRVRNALMLVRDKAEDQLPHQGIALAAVGRAMGYPAGSDPGQIVDDYRRVARRARRVVEEIFYASPGSAARGVGAGRPARQRRVGQSEVGGVDRRGVRPVAGQHPLGGEAEGHDGRAADGVDDEVVGRADDDQQGADRIERAGQPDPARAGASDQRDAAPQRPGDVQARHGRELVGVRGDARVGQRAPGVELEQRVDVVVLRQQPRRRERVEAETEQPEQGGGEHHRAGPAVDMRAPDEQPHHDGDRHDEVQRRVVVVHDLGDPLVRGHEVVERQLEVQMQDVLQVLDPASMPPGDRFLRGNGVATYRIQEVADRDDRDLLPPDRAAPTQQAMRQQTGEPAPCRCRGSARLRFDRHHGVQCPIRC